MERLFFEELVEWKNSPTRKPLILQGARQVGKTWLLKEFGKKEYSSLAYINMDENPRMKETFSKDFDVHRIISDLSIESGVRILPEETLIVLDEVQEVPQAISSLKYFCENAREYHIIVAGSLLGVAINSGISYPVGKVNLLRMYPMSFVEYMMATGEDELAVAIQNPMDDRNTVFRDRIVENLKKYYYIGGMPEVVSTYRDTGNFERVREVQNDLISLYETDFSKHIDKKSELERTRMVWNSIPMQLAKENKKFFFGQIKKGARASEFEVSIQWLVDCGLINKVYQVTKLGIPLKSYTEFSAYKLFMSDIGLLCALSEVPPRIILEGNSIFTEFKGAMAEQYVLQQMICSGRMTPYYYSNEKSRNEIDFLVQSDMDVVPVEVKAERNLQSKSLRAYVDKFDVKKAVRLSLDGYRQEDWLVNLPLWNVSSLMECM